MMKKSFLGLMVVAVTVAMCITFFLLQPDEPKNHSSTTQPASVTNDNTNTTNQALNETTNTTNQSISSIPLEKPPFLK
jgi:uncharacterized protein YpmS